MTDTDYSESRGESVTSTEELAAGIRAHHERLLSAAGEMPKNSDRTRLETILKTYLRPFVEEISSATENAKARDAAVAYLGVCRTHVISYVPEQRRHETHEELAELERLIRACEPGEHGTLVHSVYELARAVDRLHGSLAGKLEEIRCELNAINGTLLPVCQAASGSTLDETVAKIHHVLKGSMTLLVGPLPEPPKPLPSTVVPPPRITEKATSTQEPELEAASHAN